LLCLSLSPSLLLAVPTFLAFTWRQKPSIGDHFVNVGLDWLLCHCYYHTL
jgi:hypothetical protein